MNLIQSIHDKNQKTKARRRMYSKYFQAFGSYTPPVEFQTRKKDSSCQMFSCSVLYKIQAPSRQRLQKGRGKFVSTPRYPTRGRRSLEPGSEKRTHAQDCENDGGITQDYRKTKTKSIPPSKEREMEEGRGGGSREQSESVLFFQVSRSS